MERNFTRTTFLEKFSEEWKAIDRASTREENPSLVSRCENSLFLQMTLSSVIWRYFDVETRVRLDYLQNVCLGCERAKAVIVLIPDAFASVRDKFCLSCTEFSLIEL